MPTAPARAVDEVCPVAVAVPVAVWLANVGVLVCRLGEVVEWTLVLLSGMVTVDDVCPGALVPVLALVSVLALAVVSGLADA